MSIETKEIKEINAHCAKMEIHNNMLYIDNVEIGTADFIQKRLAYADDCDNQIPIIKENILKLRGGSL